MTQMRTVTVPSYAADLEKLSYFRYGHVADQILLTNDAGEWQFLSDDEFRSFLNGDIEPGHERYESLQSKGFLRKDLDLDALADRVARKKSFLGRGPHLHVAITTLRCNQSCKYCHASRTDMDRVDTDMSLDVAKQAVDMGMQSTSQYINFEFQGGEPTVNFDAIKFIVEYGREKNRYENKILDFSVVTNMTAMTEEKADWLCDNNVLVCTSLDGPEELHNWNRAWKGGGNAYQTIMKWVKYFNARWVDMGRDPDLWHVDALMTTTRKSFDHWQEIIDLYLSLRIRSVHLRALNPFGFAMNTWKRIGYTMEEYLANYKRSLDYIIELNKQGEEIIEGTAAIFLNKILTPDDPNFVDIRSPVGAGTGQLAYNYNGNIYPADEGRMVAAMGDEFFLVGELGKTSYEEVVSHPTVRTMAVASLQDTLPMCSDCWNKPYCGVRPTHNYMMTGDLFGQRPNTPKCKEHMFIARLLFEYLAQDSTGELEKIFRRWIIQRPRETSE